MNLQFFSDRPVLLHTVEDVVRIFFPGVKFVGQGSDAVLSVVTSINEKIEITARISTENDGGCTVAEEYNCEEERENQIRRVSRLAVYHLLKKETDGTGSPWGILTGIRPTKIVHRWMDQGMTRPEIEQRLRTRFELSEEKSRLLIDVSHVQRSFIADSNFSEHVSVYIGIPFCPTRCIYCSFSAEPLSTSKNLVQPYLEALHREIAHVSIAVKNLGLKVQSVYLGGGTPSCLDHRDFALLLSHIGKAFINDDVKEFTVEAGRPDTLDRSKFNTMKKLGVSRISVNPQTMHQKTLDLIGRQHTVEEIVEKYLEARDTGFLLNMDIILGLPGETPWHVGETLDQIAELRPDNLTVHTLAVKRNSVIYRERGKYPLAGAEEAEKMMDISREKAAAMGMFPYYLYRQKNILGHLENTGYCRQGKECLYNINMIEERQTIIGMGVGAGSKLINSNGMLDTSIYNPKDITCYLERIDMVIKKKIDKLVSIVYNK